MVGRLSERAGGWLGWVSGGGTEGRGGGGGGEEGKGKWKLRKEERHGKGKGRGRGRESRGATLMALGHNGVLTMTTATTMMLAKMTRKA